MIRLTATAESDLVELWRYVAVEGSEASATRLLADIEKAMQPLLDFPQSAPLRERLAAGLRVKFHGRYAIYYQSSEREILIIRVLHGARDVAALAERGGFLPS